MSDRCSWIFSRDARSWESVDSVEWNPHATAMYDCKRRCTTKVAKPHLKSSLRPDFYGSLERSWGCYDSSDNHNYLEDCCTYHFQIQKVQRLCTKEICIEKTAAIFWFARYRPGWLSTEWHETRVIEAMSPRRHHYGFLPSGRLQYSAKLDPSDLCNAMLLRELAKKNICGALVESFLICCHCWWALGFLGVWALSGRWYRLCAKDRSSWLLSAGVFSLSEHQICYFVL